MPSSKTTRAVTFSLETNHGETPPLSEQVDRPPHGDLSTWLSQVRLHGVGEIIDLLLGFLFRPAVALLKPAGDLVALAGGDVEVVVGELAPFLFHLTFEFGPFSCDLVP